MKLLFFDDFKLGVLKGDAVVDVSDAVKDIPHTGPHNLISGLIERFADYKGRLEERGRPRSGQAGQPGQDPAAAPEALQHRRMAVNYMEDGTRSEPAPINAFHKSPNSRHRRRRHHGAARRAGHHLRGRGRGGARHRQAGDERQRRPRR